MKPYQIGEQIGPYRITARLPQGGMAMVYIARPLPGHTGPPEVALKVADETYNDFLKYEIEMLQRLRHPAILRLLPIASRASMDTVSLVYNAKVEPRNPQSPYYIVMEYMRGGSLENLIEQMAPLSPVASTHIALRIADALDYMHTRHIVHLDIKPSNILLRERLSRWSSASPEVVISDFGIAQFIGGTRYMRQLGTTGYTPPECLLEGIRPHPQHDVYALGVMLYRMLTGRMPFDGPVLSPGVSLPTESYPTRLNPAISPELEAVVLQAIATDYKQRYPSMRHMQHALHRLPEARKPARVKLPFIQGVPDSVVYSISGAVLALFVILAVVLGMSVLIDQQPREHEAPARQESGEQMEQMTSETIPLEIVGALWAEASGHASHSEYVLMCPAQQGCLHDV
jgi:serine/threonine-protein kinase